MVVPDLLAPEPWFYGRQLPTDSGDIDLFGFGKYGLLTVYELKAAKIRRNALCQVVDYALRIEKMSDEDLTWHIVRESGKPGSGTGRTWKPEVLLDRVKKSRAGGKFVFRVIIGTEYDDHIAFMAERMEIELYTVAQLCQDYRKRLRSAE